MSIGKRVPVSQTRLDLGSTSPTTLSPLLPLWHRFLCVFIYATEHNDIAGPPLHVLKTSAAAHHTVIRSFKSTYHFMMGYDHEVLAIINDFVKYDLVASTLFFTDNSKVCEAGFSGEDLHRR